TCPRRRRAHCTGGSPARSRAAPCDGEPHDQDRISPRPYPTHAVGPAIPFPPETLNAGPFPAHRTAVARPAARPPVPLGRRGGAVGARDPPAGRGRLRRAPVRQGLGAVAAGRHGAAGDGARPPAPGGRPAARATRRDARAAPRPRPGRAAVHPLVLLGGGDPAGRVPAGGLRLRRPTPVPARSL